MGRKYCSEVGIYYLILAQDESAPIGDTEFHYQWKHIPTQTTGTRRIAIVGGQSCLDKLLNYWNRTGDWHYWA